MKRLGLSLLGLLPLIVTGCDDPPTCALLASVSGAISGDANWALEGADNCGIGDPANVAPGGSVLVYVARDGDVYQQIIITSATPAWAAGEFTGDVLFVTPDDLWQSAAGACTIVLTKWDVEPWSRIDFVQYEGVVDCPDPLISQTGAAPLQITTMGIIGHVWNEQLPFDNI